MTPHNTHSHKCPSQLLWLIPFFDFCIPVPPVFPIIFIIRCWCGAPQKAYVRMYVTVPTPHCRRSPALGEGKAGSGLMRIRWRRAKRKTGRKAMRRAMHDTMTMTTTTIVMNIKMLLFKSVMVMLMMMLMLMLMLMLLMIMIMIMMLIMMMTMTMTTTRRQC